MRILAAFIYCLLFCVNAFANDVITLKTGRVIEGKIYRTLDNGDIMVHKLDGNYILVDSTDILSITQNDKDAFKSSSKSKNYSHISLGYNASFINPKEGDEITLNGFSIQYDYGFHLGHSVFLELGGAIGYSSDWKYASMKYLQISAPISIGYKIKLSDSFSLMPYTGIYFKNAIGKIGAYNIFSYDFNRFQMGWHIGMRAIYNNWTIGLRYNNDFIKLLNLNHNNGEFKFHINTSGIIAAVGYSF